MPRRSPKRPQISNEPDFLTATQERALDALHFCAETTKHQLQLDDGDIGQVLRDLAEWYEPQHTYSTAEGCNGQAD